MSNSFSSTRYPGQTRRRFGGRQPLCGCGVTSWICPTSRPVACSERMAVSRPAPGPLTKMSTRRIPCSCALRAAFSAASCAAKGVDLREPLKPTCPEDAHEITFPVGSVIDTIVLLNVLLMYACPWATFFFSLRRTFLTPAPVRALGGMLWRLLLPSGLLLAGDGLLRALAGAGIGLGALAVHRQTPAVPDALVAADLDLAADVLRHLAAQVALDPVVRLDVVAQPDQVLVGQVAGAQVRAHAGGGERLVRAGLADAVDVGEGDLHPLLAGEVDAGEACHAGWISFCRGGLARSRPCRPGTAPASDRGWPPSREVGR